MDNLATTFADKLEEYAGKIRLLTVDRVNRILKLTAVGLVIAFLALVAVVFLLVALFRLVSFYTSVEWSYAIFGGLFIVAGALVWWKRNSDTK